MSATGPYWISDDDDEQRDSQSDYDLIGYSPEDSDAEIVGVNDCTSLPPPPSTRTGFSATPTCKPAKNALISAPDVEINSYRRNKGNVLKPGDTVELENHSEQQSHALHSGDYLRIKHIIMNLETDEVRLRGHRMRRTKYLGQIFDWKLNELAMVLRISEGDDRSILIAGLEDVDVDEVVCKRECTLTNKPYDLLSFRTEGNSTYPVNMSNGEIRRQMFQGGRLTCRAIHIQYFSRKAKSYSGVVRHLYAHEADMLENHRNPLQLGISRQLPILIKSDEEDGCTIVTKDSPARKRRERSASLESLERQPPKRKAQHPVKDDRLTFADAFCGAGGASQGASQAGFHVRWGLDNNERAIKAFHLNHPSAYVLKMSAHDFPPEGISKEAWRVDVLHLSPPCCFWSPAHTCDGPNDQANYEAIYTVGPILKEVKPRVATLEQTFGLATHREHNRNFLLLLRDIRDAGYDVRYKIQDLSEFGLVQRRKRLLIIAARRGTPLPLFPKATHGPSGSGLKPPVYISQALLPMPRLRTRATTDPYHVPRLFPVPKPAYNANTFLKGCITTGGTTAYHPSGTRNFTARELCLLQSFPYTYQFVGPQGEAKKQIGNAFPPIMAEALYRNIAKTLKAFDEGVIGAEDDLTDLDEILQERERRLPQRREPGFGFGFGLSRSQPTNLPHRSARSNNQTSSTAASPFARGQGARSVLSRAGDQDRFSSMNLFDGVLTGIQGFANSTASPGRREGGRRGYQVPERDKEIIDLLSDDD